MTPGLWFFAVVVTYAMADWIYRFSGKKAWCHPVFLPVVLVISAICVFEFPVAPFEEGTLVLKLLLTAAVAALAVPLYDNFSAIKKEPVAVIVSIAGGAITGTGTAVCVAVLAEGSKPVIMTMFTKSVTTPIAIVVADTIGGVPSLAAAVVIAAGLFVAIVGPWVLRKAGVDDDLIVGTAMGVSGHGLGMAESVRRSDLMGTGAAFAMAANGLVTALVLSVFFS